MLEHEQLGRSSLTLHIKDFAGERPQWCALFRMVVVCALVPKLHCVMEILMLALPFRGCMQVVLPLSNRDEMDVVGQ